MKVQFGQLTHNYTLSNVHHDPVLAEGANTIDEVVASMADSFKGQQIHLTVIPEEPAWPQTSHPSFNFWAWDKGQGLGVSPVSIDHRISLKELGTPAGRETLKRMIQNAGQEVLSKTKAIFLKK